MKEFTHRYRSLRLRRAASPGREAEKMLVVVAEAGTGILCSKYRKLGVGTCDRFLQTGAAGEAWRPW